MTSNATRRRQDERLAAKRAAKRAARSPPRHPRQPAHVDDPALGALPRPVHVAVHVHLAVHDDPQPARRHRLRVPRALDAPQGHAPTTAGSVAAARAALGASNRYMTGVTSRLRMVELMRPPMMTQANGE